MGKLIIVDECPFLQVLNDCSWVGARFVDLMLKVVDEADGLQGCHFPDLGIEYDVS